MKTDRNESSGRRSISVAKAAAALVGVATIVAAVFQIREYYDARATYDLSGEWQMNNEVARTDFNPYKGLRLGYRLFLKQDGLRLEGTGEKWWENGREI